MAAFASCSSSVATTSRFSFASRSLLFLVCCTDLSFFSTIESSLSLGIVTHLQLCLHLYLSRRRSFSSFAGLCNLTSTSLRLYKPLQATCSSKLPASWPSSSRCQLSRTAEHSLSIIFTETVLLQVGVLILSSVQELRLLIRTPSKEEAILH